MQFTKFKILLILSFSLSRLLFGQTSKVGTTAAQFLKIGVGARAVAMGEAFAGAADDISAIYWNPAGLVQIPQRQVMFLHSQWLATLKFNFAVLSLPISPKAGTLAFSATVLSSPEEPVRTVYAPQGTGETFQSMDLALGLTYARHLTAQLLVGVNVKYIRQAIWQAAGSSVALDFGGLFQTNFRNLRIGMAISNFGTPLEMGGASTTMFADADPAFNGDNPVIVKIQTEAWELPLNFRVGLALDLLKMRNIRLTLVSDMLHPNDNSPYLNVGSEYAIKEFIFFRGGYRGLGMPDPEGGLTLGGGLSFPVANTRFRLDYAYVSYNRLEATHRYTLTWSF